MLSQFSEPTKEPLRRGRTFLLACCALWALINLEALLRVEVGQPQQAGATKKAPPGERGHELCYSLRSMALQELEDVCGFKVCSRGLRSRFLSEHPSYCIKCGRPRQPSDKIHPFNSLFALREV